MEALMRGTIKWLNEMTGYGIIDSGTSSYTFKICSNGIPILSLKEGGKINFKIYEDANSNSKVKGLYISIENDKNTFVLA